MYVHNLQIEISKYFFSTKEMTKFYLDTLTCKIDSTLLYM